MKIAIVIPTLNEAEWLPRLLEHLRKTQDGCSITVADAGSTDGTRAVARAAGAVWLECDERSRACQMNAGAQHSAGDVLYFIHADTLPPESWATDIRAAVRHGNSIGGYRFKFDSKRPMLAFNSFFTRFNLLTFRGGDQSLFITRVLWELLDGYRKEMCIMEEYDLIERAAAAGHPYHLMPKATLVSARKYDHNSYLKVQRANLMAMRGYRKGVAPAVIRERYHRMLQDPKD